MLDPSRCETCDCRVGNGVSYYERVIYVAHASIPRRHRFCSIPCLTRAAYGNVEAVELPGGEADA